MKRNLKIVLLVTLLVAMMICLTGCTKQSRQEDTTIQITTTFYPMYTIAINLVEGAKEVSISNLASQEIGCIHDYTMSTNDLRKLEKTDILIENGLGLEDFIDKVKSTYQNMKVINTSEKIQDTVKNGDEINGHVWTSIDYYQEQVKTISQKLQEYDGKNASIYQKNEEKYLTKLQDLKKEYEETLQGLKGQGVVVLNESFVYFAKQAGMDMTILSTDHEESTISAEVMKQTIQKMQDKKINMVLIDQADATKNADIIAKETGAKVIALNSVLSGDETKDSYINAMRENYETIHSFMIQK